MHGELDGTELTGVHVDLGALRLDILEGVSEGEALVLVEVDEDGGGASATTSLAVDVDLGVGVLADVLVDPVSSLLESLGIDGLVVAGLDVDGLDSRVAPLLLLDGLDEGALLQFEGLDEAHNAGDVLLLDEGVELRLEGQSSKDNVLVDGVPVLLALGDVGQERVAKGKVEESALALHDEDTERRDGERDGGHDAHRRLGEERQLRGVVEQVGAHASEGKSNGSADNPTLIASGGQLSGLLLSRGTVGHEGDGKGCKKGHSFSFFGLFCWLLRRGRRREEGLVTSLPLFLLCASCV